MKNTELVIHSAREKSVSIATELQSVANELGVLHAVLKTTVRGEAQMGAELREAIDRVIVIEKKLVAAALNLTELHQELSK